MTVYRDVGHVVARVMSIEANDGTAKAGWQMRYRAGFPESRGGGGEALSPEERLTQDSMTRAALHRALSPAAWYALVAKYSINDVEVLQAVRWLVARVEAPAHHLFKTKCVTAWAVPRRLPPAFYQLHTWDSDGTPEGTLRRWRCVVKQWLDARVEAGFQQALPVLEEAGVIESNSA